MKKYFAEFIGTMVLTLLGCGTAVFVGVPLISGAIAALVWNCLGGECKCCCSEKK